MSFVLGYSLLGMSHLYSTAFSTIRAERAKEEKLELKRLVDAQVAEAKRKEAADRIEANLKAARAKEEEKRADLMEKQSKHSTCVYISFV